MRGASRGRAGARLGGLLSWVGRASELYAVADILPDEARPQRGLGRLLGKDPLEIDLDVARRGGMEAQQLRAAANAPIQGSSADIIKVAMVQLQAALQNQGLPAQLLLQVHDELVLEVQPDAMETTRELVRQTMENAVQLSVPLVAETGEGANWMETK